jgi:threonine dehydrogenase-like Zn-dependent dehydrogenase
MDPSFVITHRVNLEEAPVAYKKFRDKEDGCIKVVLKPQLDDSVKTTTINGN